MQNDMVNSPSHYQSETGLECREVCEYHVYFLANAIKYLWRWRDKGTPVQDLEKARYCINAFLDQTSTKTQRARGLSAVPEEMEMVQAHTVRAAEILHDAGVVDRLGIYVDHLQDTRTPGWRIMRHLYEFHIHQLGGVYHQRRLLDVRKELDELISNAKATLND